MKKTPSAVMGSRWRKGLAPAKENEDLRVSVRYDTSITNQNPTKKDPTTMMMMFRLYPLACLLASAFAFQSLLPVRLAPSKVSVCQPFSENLFRRRVTAVGFFFREVSLVGIFIPLLFSTTRRTLLWLSL